MDVDPRAGDALQNALVGCRLAALIMLRLQAIDRNHHVQQFVCAPGRRHSAKRARHDLRVDAALLHLRQNLLQFAVADQGVASDERNMQRLVLIDHCQHIAHQRVALEVRKLAQFSARAQVRRVEGIAAGAAQRAFLGDLDRKGGRAAAQNTCPGLQNF